MRYILSVFALALMLGCSVTVLPGPGIPEPYTSGGPSGGTWACIHVYDYENIRRYNQAIIPYRCNPWVRGIIEFYDNEVGWWLEFTTWNANNSFQIDGSDLYYQRIPRHEVRWRLDGNKFIITSAYIYRYDYQRLNHDVFLLDGKYVMLRIGSRSYAATFELIECVAENRKRKLFELETCPRPPYWLP